MSSFDQGQGTVYALSWQRPLQMLPMIACIPLPEACPITLPYPPRGARRARVHQQIAGRICSRRRPTRRGFALCAGLSASRQPTPVAHYYHWLIGASGIVRLA